MKFRNPSNDYVEESNNCGLWCLIFGCFYLALKGAWGHAFVAFFAACFTAGISWFIYPFFAEGIVRSVYLRRGWQEVQIQTANFNPSVSASTYAKPPYVPKKLSKGFILFIIVIACAMVASIIYEFILK